MGQSYAKKAIWGQKCCRQPRIGREARGTMCGRHVDGPVEFNHRSVIYKQGSGRCELDERTQTGTNLRQKTRW